MLFLKVKVAATEYGYALAALRLIVGALVRLGGVGRSASPRPARLMRLAGSLLLVLPVLRAALCARGLPERLGRAFGERASRALAQPFSLARLLKPWPRSLAAERIVFSKTAEYSLELDLYRPDHTPAAGSPCVVVVHGGKWTEGDSRQFASLNPYLARKGYLVAVVNYRKADRFPFPAARDDLRAAIEYVKRNAKELGADPERLALLGRSAGGQLALLVAYERPDPAIRGVISFYSPTDMHYGYRDPTNPRVIDHEQALEVYLRGDPESAPEAYDAASPISFVRAGVPPTLLVHGAQDEMVHVAQSDRLAARLRAAGVPHLYLRLPWATHGLDHNLGGPSGQVSTGAVEGFLAAVLR